MKEKNLLRLFIELNEAVRILAAQDRGCIVKTPTGRSEKLLIEKNLIKAKDVLSDFEKTLSETQKNTFQSTYSRLKSIRNATSLKVAS